MVNVNHASLWPRAAVLATLLLAASSCAPDDPVADGGPGRDPAGDPSSVPDGLDGPGEIDAGPALRRHDGPLVGVLADLDLYLNGVSGTGTELLAVGGIRGDGQFLHH